MTSAGDLQADIAIIGGGLMGATLTLLLARALPHCRLHLLEQLPFSGTLEALPQRSFDDRSTALAPSSVDALEAVGLWSALTDQVCAIEHIQVSDRGHPGWASLGAAENNGRPLGYVVSNRALGRVLIEGLQRAPQVTLDAPSSVSRLQPMEQGVCLHLTDGRRLHAQLAVIADGAESPLRRSLGIGARVKDYRQVAVVANIRHQQPHRGRAFERFGSRGPLAVLPLPDVHTSALVWTWPQVMAERVKNWSDEEFLAELQRQFGWRLGRLAEVGQRQMYPLQLSLAEQQVRSGLVLMGNAAHYLHPVAGQGYNLSVRDALRLAEVLSLAHGQPLGDLALLQRYEHAQHDDQWRTVRLSDGFNEIFRARSPALTLLRTLGMATVELCRPIRSGLIRQLSGRASPRANPWG